MKLHALLGEVWRNVVSGTSRTIALASIFALLLTAMALADAMVVSNLVTEARDFQARAASLVTVSAEGRVSGASCEALTGVRGVQAAGAMRATTESLHLATLPGSPVPVIEVSPGFLATLGSAGQAGARASTNLLDALGSEPGDALLADTGPLVISGSYDYPSDGRRSGLGWALLIPETAVGLYDECWIKIWPWNDDVLSLLKGSVLSLDEQIGSDREVLQAQLNTTLGSRFDGHVRFQARITRFAPLAAFGLGLLLAVVAVRLRRLELAARLHDGTRLLDLVCQVSLESCVWLSFSFLVSWASAMTYSSYLGGQDATDLAMTSVFIPAAGLLGGVAGTLVGTVLVRERHLFSYFKDR